MKLDQFYTKLAVAEKCYEFFISKLSVIDMPLRDTYFVEPSAGSGNFFNLLNPKKRIGLDIDPRGTGIKKQDFLKCNFDRKGQKNVAVIGNPPFGHRARLAVDFFNKSAEFADVIGFVVPVQFRKYSVHTKLNKNYKLIAEKILPKNSFITESGEDFDVNCVFQVWTRRDTKLPDKRIRKPPPINHPDFAIYQYNNTKQALRVFRYDFDFAVPRQGYENYRRREVDVQRLERNKQWALFKAYDEETKAKLINMDFEKLAAKNTVIPGFGKADVVEEYSKICRR